MSVFSKRGGAFWIIGSVVISIVGAFSFLFVGLIPLHDTYLHDVEKKYAKITKHPNN